MIPACVVTFVIASNATPYAPEIFTAMNDISNESGVSFTQVAGPADITFLGVPAVKKTDGRMPLGSWDGRVVRLSPVRPMLRLPLVMHEVMHAIGVSHTTVGNVSAPLLTKQTILGPDDKAALHNLGCSHV